MNGVDTSTTATPVSHKFTLVPQTGMPPNVVSRSREIIYDSLQQDIRFVKNPFGPQPLRISRPNHRW
jgi:hypothetical protein